MCTDASVVRDVYSGSPHPPLPRCIVVDGSVAIVRALQVILTGLGWEAKATAFAGNAFVEVLRLPTSLLLTGLRPANGCGLRLIKTLRQRGWTGRVVILTARPERIAPAVLHSLDIAAVLKKPFRLERLREVVGQEIGKKV